MSCIVVAATATALALSHLMIFSLLLLLLLLLRPSLLPPARQAIPQLLQQRKLQRREGQVAAGEGGVAAPELGGLGAEAGDCLGGGGDARCFVYCVACAVAGILAVAFGRGVGGVGVGVVGVVIRVGDDGLGILLDDFGGREDGARDEFGDGGGGCVDEGLGEGEAGCRSIVIVVVVVVDAGRQTGLDGFVCYEKGSCWCFC